MANGNNGTSGHEQELVDVQDLKATLKKGGNKGLFNEAICSTAGGTAAKTVTAPASFSLANGATILVKFTNAITVTNSTLAVGSTAAKPIYYKGAALEADVVEAGDIIILRYDGTNYNVVGKLGGSTKPERIGFGKGTCTTSSGTALTVSLAGYELVHNGFVAVTFEHDVPANATLNINSKGAKAIYFKGAALAADVIKAGDIVTIVYNGTQFEVTNIETGNVVRSGFSLSTDETTGTDIFTPLGAATITHDDTTGGDSFDF